VGLKSLQSGDGPGLVGDARVGRRVFAVNSGLDSSIWLGLLLKMNEKGDNLCWRCFVK
jgi:hypothetical protein